MLLLVTLLLIALLALLPHSLDVLAAVDASDLRSAAKIAYQAKFMLALVAFYSFELFHAGVCRLRGVPPTVEHIRSCAAIHLAIACLSGFCVVAGLVDRPLLSLKEELESIKFALAIAVVGGWRALSHLRESMRKPHMAADRRVRMISRAFGRLCVRIRAFWSRFHLPLVKKENQGPRIKKPPMKVARSNQRRRGVKRETRK